MSIHRSKGLEFPVVFIGGTARSFNLADTRESVLMHPQLGLGPKLTDAARGIEYPTLARRAVARRLERELLSEELRLLYVCLLYTSHMHPEGWQGEYDEAAQAALERINIRRRRAAGPLRSRERACRAARTASEQARALADFFAELELAERLAARADELEAAGRLQAAEEYARLWEAAVSALEQCAQVLGGTELDAAGFQRLYLLTLSQYAVGVIPVSLDMVSAGDMDRMRRRHIKHLIVLGASDERLPGPAREGGVFSAEERRALAELGLPLDAGDAELWREYSLIYNLSLIHISTRAISPRASRWPRSSRPAACSW